MDIISGHVLISILNLRLIDLQFFQNAWNELCFVSFFYFIYFLYFILFIFLAERKLIIFSLFLLQVRH